MAQQVGWQNQFDDDAIVSAALECSPCAFTDAYYAVRHSKELQSDASALKNYEQTCQHLRPRGGLEFYSFVLCFLIILIMIVFIIIIIIVIILMVAVTRMQLHQCSCASELHQCSHTNAFTRIMLHKCSSKNASADVLLLKIGISLSQDTWLTL